MCDILFLPISIGEAIDKLTILDIKLQKISDSRKNSVQIEYNMLYEQLKNIIIEYNLYYNMMKQINLDIWDMMDILRDSNIDNQQYLIKCKECIEANDIRFRIKNKINYVSRSILKEQKGYNVLTYIFNMSELKVDEITKEITNIIKYYSFLYDEIIIITNKDNNQTIKSIFVYDSTIKIHPKESNNEESNNEESNNDRRYNFINKEIEEIYKELNITTEIKNRYFINFE